MGYHIFTARKLGLTSLINDWEAKEMRFWCQQVALANQVDEIYDRFLDGDGTDLSDGDEAAIEALKEQEDNIERKIQMCETHIEEFTKELEKAEEQEQQAIDNDIPNYKGAGGSKG